MGEVHDAEDAEDEREAGGDEEEEPGERERVEELLDEVEQHAGPSASCFRYENSSVRHFGVTLSPGYVARIFGTRCGYFGSFTASTANPGCTA